MKKQNVRIFWDMDGVLVKTLSDPNGYSNPEVFDNLGSIKGAKEVISIMYRFGELYDFSMHICSKTSKRVLEDPKGHERQAKGKLSWLSNVGILHMFNSVVIMDGVADKNILVKSAYDILIDDYGLNCQKWIEAGGTAVQMFEHKTKPNYETANDWTELLSELVFFLEKARY